MANLEDINETIELIKTKVKSIQEQDKAFEDELKELIDEVLTLIARRYILLAHYRKVSYAEDDLRELLPKIYELDKFDTFKTPMFEFNNKRNTFIFSWDLRHFSGKFYRFKYAMSYEEVERLRFSFLSYGEI